MEFKTLKVLNDYMKQWCKYDKWNVNRKLKRLRDVRKVEKSIPTDENGIGAQWGVENVLKLSKA